MQKGDQTTFQLFEGPSLTAPFAAVVAEFDNRFPKALPSHEILQLLHELFPSASSLAVVLGDDNVDFAALVAGLTNAWQEQLWQHAPPSQITRLEEGRCRISVGFYDPDVTRSTLLAGIEMAEAVFARASGTAAEVHAPPTVQRIIGRVPGRPLSRTSAALFHYSRARGIPAYIVCKDAGICMYGQGAKAFTFLELADHQDSFTGRVLSKNKALTAQFLQRLGFPTAQHAIAADAANARRIAAKLKFPLVVKPIDRGRGVGVAVGIGSDDELVVAFERARAASNSRQVLVERFVPGDDHRLSVFGGKLLRVSRLLPPKIVGDGTRTVAELIEAENRNRSDPVAARIFLSRLTIDQDMIALLRRQGFALGDRPPHGLELRLRNTSNLHTGGTREDVTALAHPDNVAMAEAVAKSFHLDAIGIDFMTPDIGKAWHESECAIIEVNINPGVSDESVLEKVLLEKFPLGTDGCIPSILIVGNDTELVDNIVQHVSACGKRVGHTSGSLTCLAGQKRFQGSADFPTRILSLLLDPTCEVLVVSCTPEEIAEYGLPHTRYRLALIAGPDSLADDIGELIRNTAPLVVEDVAITTPTEVLLPLIADVVNED